MHALTADQHDIAELFGAQTGDETDKFEQCEWEPTTSGPPRLLACDRWFVGAIREHFDGGDHVGFVLDIVEAQAPPNPAPPLTYQQVRDIDAGHEA